MKKFILLLAAVGLTSSMAGAEGLNFASGLGSTLNSSSDTLPLTINTANNTVTSAGEAANFMNNIVVSGANSVDDDFIFTLNAGFGFDPTAGNETWDTTDASANNTFRIFAGRGIGPRGANGNPKFRDGEILWFEVSGLDAGNSLELNGFTMFDDNGAESTFFNYYTGDSGGTITLGGTATDGGVTTFGSALSLSNGDRFGIAYSKIGDTANRSYLSSLDINMIPEPATIGMLGLGALVIVLHRKKMNL